MFLFIFKTVFLFFTLNKYVCVEGLDIHRHSARIIQGTDVNIKEFPYYAGLLQCGATILSERWVVTAAHCLIPRLTILNFLWVGGESFTISKIVTFDKVVFHDKIKSMNSKELPVYDIALLRLSVPLEFTDKIRPVDLPSDKDLLRSYMDSKLVVAGRGLNENGHLANNLQKMDMLRLSTEECLSYMPYEVQEQIKPIIRVLEKAIICAKRVEGGPGVCQGDSGSPLTQGNTLVGIVSFIGAPCNEANLVFFVNVANYVPWIKSVTGLK